MTIEQVVALLRQQCDAEGAQAAWAKAHGVSPGYTNDTLQRRRDPGEAILRALGLVRIVTYKRGTPSFGRTEK